MYVTSKFKTSCIYLFRYFQTVQPDSWVKQCKDSDESHFFATVQSGESFYAQRNVAKVNMVWLATVCCTEEGLLQQPCHTADQSHSLSHSWSHWFLNVCCLLCTAGQTHLPSRHSRASARWDFRLLFWGHYHQPLEASTANTRPTLWLLINDQRV